MTTATTEHLTLPVAALRLNVSLDVLRGVLRRTPDLDGAIPRIGGRRLIGPDQLAQLRQALAERPTITTHDHH